MAYQVPQKKIAKMFDLNPWCHSKAYREYMDFLHRLNDAVIGVKTTDDVPMSQSSVDIIDFLDDLQKWTLMYPAEDMGSQRFGNKAYRDWYARLEQDVPELITEFLPAEHKAAASELVPYIMDSFGNNTRIDYGSGHEAAFVIFLLCLFKIGYFKAGDEKSVVLRVFNKYLKVCRHLQEMYRMEPAGSRGVHAIDDFQFVPFIWGSAQLIGNKRRLVPDSYTKYDVVESHYHESLFLEAVDHIYKTKTGPFHEHSNQLWNISAVPTWEKVNQGMFKMYEAEVLKKFPVVQHILFGSLFSFERREDAPNEPLTRQPVDA